MTFGDAAAALRPALRVAIIAAVGLAVPALAVLGLGDARCFTAPPESVAEQFVRKLALRRWSPARAQLTPELAAALPEPALRAAAEAFERRRGTIERVEGRPGAVSAEGAWATALVTTSHGARVPVALPLSRRSGVWRVAGLGGLAAVP